MVVRVGLGDVLDRVNGEGDRLAVDGHEHYLLLHVHEDLVWLNPSGVLRWSLKKNKKTRATNRRTKHSGLTRKPKEETASGSPPRTKSWPIKLLELYIP